MWDSRCRPGWRRAFLLQTEVGDEPQTIDENGYYYLFTVGKSAAPLGFYKITVAAYETDADIAKRAASPGEAGRKVQRLIDPKYENPTTTPLVIEVIENAPPGTYDLKLTR